MKLSSLPMLPSNPWRVATFVLLLVGSIGYIGLQERLNINKQFDAQYVEQIAQLHDKEETLDLAIEFGFDPIIVQVTQQLAKDAFLEHACQSCSTWRWIKTDKELTYVILSIIAIESRGNYQATNQGGYAGIGLTQLVLSTARMYDKDVQQSELLTIPKNLQIAMKYFIDLLERFHGNSAIAVIAWNRGPNGVDRLFALGQSPENGYTMKVFTQAALRNANR